MRRIRFLFAMGFFSFLFGSSSRAQTQEQPASKPSAETTSPASKIRPEDVGRGLRQMFLTTPAEEIGGQPSKEFPRVYGILMDFPIRSEFATILSTSTGTASLYTTAKFGIIGGEGHESVKQAAKNFVQAAELNFDDSKPTSDYPYPASDRIRFYLLTFTGVRVIDDDFAAIENRTSKYTALFDMGQAVLTELRLVTEKRQ
jgi:hypothetical protein